jgi:hypothetical protein
MGKKQAKVPKMNEQAARNKRRDRARVRALKQRAKLIRLGKMEA